MSDRRKSIPALPPEPSPEPDTTETPPSPLDTWDELDPLRATFLRYVFDPEAIAGLRAVARFFYSAVLEWRGDEDEEEPLILSELRAVAADLRYTAGFLYHRTAADDRVTMKDRRLERWLGSQAEEWADQLGEIASEIEQAVAE